jgi:hypothetical protein
MARAPTYYLAIATGNYSSRGLAAIKMHIEVGSQPVGALGAALSRSRQGVDAVSLMKDFDAVGGKHEAMRPEAFNEDHVYKRNLNEVLGISIKRNLRNVCIDKI